MGTIVVGVDRSATARRAAEQAARLAARTGSDLHLVMCAERTQGERLSPGVDDRQTDWWSEADRFLGELAARIGGDRTATHAVTEGSPAKALCAEAARIQAELIVVGNRRAQGLARVLGSVAGDVVRHADCDVYVANTAVA